MPATARALARGTAALVSTLTAASVLAPAALAEPTNAEPTNAGPGPQPLRTNGAPVPEISWGPCSAEQPDYECATADVPLSYRDPSGPSIELALGKLPATDQENKIGTIFYNPGGPGGPGQIPPELTPELHERFDIVGFDPRGIGASTGLRCFDSAEESDRVLNGPFPITPAQEKQKVADSERGSEICAQQAGPLIDHMSTANVARDMDLLRQSLGEDQLSYYGVSYGTHVGAVYANLFPERVRALTVDSALDPVEWTTGYDQSEFIPFTYRLGSHGGAQNALHSFLNACGEDDRCSFREPGVDLLAKYNALLDRLKDKPITLRTPDGKTVEIDYQTAVDRTKGSLYHADSSPILADFLQELHKQSQPETASAVPPVVTVPEPAPGPGFIPDQQRLGAEQKYLGAEQGGAVFCSDSKNNPRNPAEWSRWAREADREAPGFGSSWTYLSLSCATWPGHDEDSYAGPWNEQTANPVLVVGNSLGDPATPYDDSVKLSNMLGDARMLTLETFGHGARGNSACVDKALSEYFINGELPEEGATCQPDRAPFDPAPQPK